MNNVYLDFLASPFESPNIYIQVVAILVMVNRGVLGRGPKALTQVVD